MFVRVCTHIVYEKDIIGIIFLNPCPFHYLLWQYYFSFTPTFPGTQLGHKNKGCCVWNSGCIKENQSHDLQH
jgi:hypothetical protein